MKFYTGSSGILARKDSIEPMLGFPLHPFNATATFSRSDVLVGWGQKANTRQIKHHAEKLGLPFWQLEDGFIGYIGHPATGGKAVSLIADPVGVYYDARQPSLLEQLIAAPCDPGLLTRADALIVEMVRLGITKYNCYTTRANGDDSGLPASLAQRLNKDNRPKILLVDQVAGDLSIPGALASEADFLTMVETARRNHPTARLLLRTHPDTRLGKKSGVLARMKRDDVEIVADHCHPHALLNQVAAVYTVSSQMGFEALLLGKPVYCFGMPFYAGWGLTHDSKSCARRQAAITLPQLVAAALIRYPRYLDPVLGQRCEVEDVLTIIARQQNSAPRCKRLYLVGFSLWKRAFMQAFCHPLADELRFVRNPPRQLAPGEQVLVWGSRHPELKNAIRVEDGFIRSRGLGSNLCRPSSLSIDPVGIYFDSRRPSRLEQLLNAQPLTPQVLERGAALIELLRQHGVSKYNVGSAQPFTPPDDGRSRVLVVGQVDGDASILTGSPVVRSNEQLLWAVRGARPDAHILYKPHPDVVAGNRAGAISAECLAKCVDSQVLDVGLTRLYPHVDELHTMTSLSGFEALVQGVSVTTWGQPFYSGWGLTEDIHPAPRRQRTLPLAALVYMTLVAYPLYIDWQSGLWMSPEQLIRQLAKQGNSSTQKSSRLQRWQIKLSYLIQTLRQRP
ncbi:capsular polysaccharide biosynthesis protein [Atlantibacter sp.]|uniref:capsular polysaccharide biosynthesis protein n=1 Tax=Atlantibacter sp. TaxID=1903473 RepID=UPI0028B13953|nr:capsular polysaccharide biosynthesis protein [Atlantibacter sp.]